MWGVDHCPYVVLYGHAHMSFGYPLGIYMVLLLLPGLFAKVFT